jgi:hypothetical protein
MLLPPRFETISPNCSGYNQLALEIDDAARESDKLRQRDQNPSISRMDPMHSGGGDDGGGGGGDGGDDCGGGDGGGGWMGTMYTVVAHFTSSKEKKERNETKRNETKMNRQTITIRLTTIREAPPHAGQYSYSNQHHLQNPLPSTASSQVLGA